MLTKSVILAKAGVCSRQKANTVSAADFHVRWEDRRLNYTQLNKIGGVCHLCKRSRLVGYRCRLTGQRNPDVEKVRPSSTYDARRTG